MTGAGELLDQLDAAAPDDPDEWSTWVTRRSCAIPQLTAALRAVLALADERDRNGVDIDPDDVITAVEQALTPHTHQEGATR